MSIDYSKYRSISSFANINTNIDGDFERNLLLNQAEEEFDYYLKYSPTRMTGYVNNSTEPILLTLQDVSDLEVSSDSKWMLTSLKNKVYVGDTILIDGRKWLSVYNKEKTTRDCYKVKVQPCNYNAKLAMFDNDGVTPIVYSIDTIVTTYETDVKDYKQPFPSELGTTYIILPYNSYTSQIDRLDRIWLYDCAFEIGGIDFSNINSYIGKGCLKLTLRPDKIRNETDNVDLGVCNYYKYFPKTTSSNTSQPSTTMAINAPDIIKTNSDIVITMSNINITDKIKYSFTDKYLGCHLTYTSDNSCILHTSSDIGIIYIKAELINNPATFTIKRVVIEN